MMSDLPVGDPVATATAQRPDGGELVGRFVSLVPADPEAHAPDLWRCSHGDRQVESLWTYLPYGPFPDVASMRRWLEGCAASQDPLFRVVLDHSSRAPVGMVSDLNVDLAMGR